MKTNKRNHLLYIALILLALAIGLTGVLISVGAEAAPTAPTTQHWHLPTGDDAWLVTEPGCNLQTTQYGGSYHFECVDDTK